MLNRLLAYIEVMLPLFRDAVGSLANFTSACHVIMYFESYVYREVNSVTGKIM